MNVSEIHVAHCHQAESRTAQISRVRVQISIECIPFLNQFKVESHGSNHHNMEPCAIICTPNTYTHGHTNTDTHFPWVVWLRITVASLVCVRDSTHTHTFFFACILLRNKLIMNRKQFLNCCIPPPPRPTNLHLASQGTPRLISYSSLVE